MGCDTNAKTQLLAYGIGNISRGDDALGPSLLNYLQAYLGEIPSGSDQSPYQITCEETFQLQPEHIYDFKHQDVILFLDADARFSSGIHFAPITGNSIAMQHAYVSHALPPEQLLAMHERLGEDTTPPAYILSMGAETMALEEGLSEQAKLNLEAAKQLLITLLATPLDQWQSKSVISI